ncbi:MAG TPA: hypothetical protein VHV08_10075 [Pirellulales bacterium]|nr:hypothetical protein [Pirellulales bacterium]
MISAETKEKLAPWLPMGFCAVLSLLTISSNLYLTLANRADVGGWAIVFLCFLPLCFFFVGIAVSRTQTQICELRKQIAQWEARRPS